MKYYQGFITELKDKEVFVFGSNEEGFHGAGSAGFAWKGSSANDWRENEQFIKALRAPQNSLLRIGKWCILGQGSGYQRGAKGASYAIYTVTRPGARRSVSLDEIYKQLEELCTFARENNELTFYSSIVGGGYSGYSKEEIGRLYEKLDIPDNIILPESIRRYTMKSREIRIETAPMSAVSKFKDSSRYVVLDITVKSSKGIGRSVAPTWDMVMDYKKGKISEHEYTELYQKILDKSFKEENRWSEFFSAVGNKTVVFVCYCKTGDFCHRLLLQTYLFYWLKDRNWKVVSTREVDFLQETKRTVVPCRNKYYAGIGARSTPAKVCNLMTKIASKLASQEFTLRSGSAEGADIAFETGGQYKKEIFTISSHIPQWAFDEANKIHETDITKLSMKVQKLLARNMMIILGEDGNTPVKFVICWTPEGKEVGGTRHAIRLAKKKGIPVFNLYDLKVRERLIRFIDKK